MLGETLAHYEILEKVGSGGMGDVYRARDKKLHRDVAIKVLSEKLASNPERLARFEREAGCSESRSNRFSSWPK